MDETIPLQIHNELINNIAEVINEIYQPTINFKILLHLIIKQLYKDILHLRKGKGQTGRKII